MRLRSSSIRARIIALLMVPFIALGGLWAYATLITTGDVRDQLDLTDTFNVYATPTERFAQDVQAERRAAVLRLAVNDQKTSDAYQKAQAATDQDLQVLRGLATGESARKLDLGQRARFHEVLGKAELLSGVRARARQGLDGWDHVLAEYSDLVQPVFAFYSSFVSRQTGQLPRQGTVLVELIRAREYLSQESAAMEGLRLTARPDDRKQQVALDSLHSQQALFRIYVGELDPQAHRDYLDLQNSPHWNTLNAAEQRFEDAGDRINEVKGNPEDPWGPTAARVLADLAELNARQASAISESVHSYAVSALIRAGIAGAIGLLAVVLSIVISYRIGRALVRELVALRNAAREASATRLPAVMQRLRRGEPVDVAAELGSFEFGPAEIGQVGRAFNEVERVAVEAAVEQAELRRGVSAVFVNLARRSQVLLHRQLTLLDTMERRTEDPVELEDLFRLDHLTTRMRRHAEGLIILSGGSPGRAWRRPVRMVDVVRAAVGEVEDYARVVVRPFPGTALVGSAVADVTHLVAELVENAAVFSPPHTQVSVQGEVVAHGFCLQIDDRGLGLSEQALETVNERLAVEPEFDLADTDRLGLFVVSRLARRHGIRVHLRPSPYGGTSAVVLIPRELLAEAAESASDQEDAPPAEEEQPVPVFRQTGGPRPAAVEAELTAGGLPRRRLGAAAAESPADAGRSGGTGRHRRVDGPADERLLPSRPTRALGTTARPAPQPVPTQPVPTPQPVPAAAIGAPRQEATTPDRPVPLGANGLPRRVRQASLAPQLRPGAEADQPVQSESVRERSPEDARATFASFQRGFQRGRGDRRQPATLSLVRPNPAPQPSVPPPPAPMARVEPIRFRVELPPPPVPAALPAAPNDRPSPVAPVRRAQPAPAEGTES